MQRQAVQRRIGWNWNRQAHVTPGIARAQEGESNVAGIEIECATTAEQDMARSVGDQ